MTPDTTVAQAYADLSALLYTRLKASESHAAQSDAAIKRVILLCGRRLLLSPTDVLNALGDGTPVT